MDPLAQPPASLAQADEKTQEEYFQGVAKARYTVRKVFRMVDEQAKNFGVDPLEHQMLIQVQGSDKHMLYVNNIADRLDIPPAFASKLVKGLEEKGLVSRSQSTEDRRLVEVTVTAKGRKLLVDIDAEVRIHVDFFQRQLGLHDKCTALSIFAFYVGLQLSPADVAGLATDHPG